jgi:uncharacterized protein (TIGR02284 family)
MLAEDYKRVNVLNNLLVVNNERLESYAYAGQQTEMSLFKDLFSRLRTSSEKLKEELCAEVYKLGGKPSSTTGGPGDLPKAWKEIRKAIRTGDYKALLDSCYLAEFMSLKTYEYALRYNRNYLTRYQHLLFDRQRVVLKQDHECVANLRSALTKV